MKSAKNTSRENTKLLRKLVHQVYPSEILEKVNKDLAHLKEQGYPIGRVSDGHHTFDELYLHRTILLALYVNTGACKAGKSWSHLDGTMFDDRFIVFIDTPTGYYSYHCERETWELFECPEYATAPEYDGHLPKDLIRLFDKGESYDEENSN